METLVEMLLKLVIFWDGIVRCDILRVLGYCVVGNENDCGTVVRLRMKTWIELLYVCVRVYYLLEVTF